MNLARSFRLAVLAAGVWVAAHAEARADYVLVGELATNSGPPNGQLQAFDSTTGNPVGSFATTSKGISSFYPRGLAAGPDGNLYVGELSTPRIDVFSPSGTFLRVFASDPTSTHINYPYGMAFSGANLFVANTNGNNITEFNSAGGVVPFTLSGLPSGVALKAPAGLAFDPAGNLYVANSQSNAVLEFNATGKYLQTFSDPSLHFATGVAIGNGKLYVSGDGTNGNGEVVAYNLSGVGSPGILNNATLGDLGGLSLGSGGLLYLASASTGTVFKDALDSSGNLTSNLSTFVSGLPQPTNVLTFAAVPEPSSLALCGLGLVGLAGLGLKRRFTPRRAD